MKPRTRKWVHASLIAVASSIGDVATQLLSGSFHWERAVIAGVVMGLFARGLGAALAAIAMPEPEQPTSTAPAGRCLARRRTRRRRDPPARRAKEAPWPMQEDYGDCDEGLAERIRRGSTAEARARRAAGMASGGPDEITSGTLAPAEPRRWQARLGATPCAFGNGWNG
jgi:hypothetical protein